MVVDFAFKRAAGFTAATVSWKGTWNEKRIRTEFEGIAKRLAKAKVRSGRWVLESYGENNFIVAIEIQGRFKSAGRTRVRSFKPSTVATVQFDPDAVSPRVIYHGLSDWLKWRKKDREIKSIGRYREVYSANPWKNAKAWSTTTVQVLVKK